MELGNNLCLPPPPASPPPPHSFTVTLQEGVLDNPEVVHSLERTLLLTWLEVGLPTQFYDRRRTGFSSNAYVYLVHKTIRNATKESSQESRTRSVQFDKSASRLLVPRLRTPHRGSTKRVKKKESVLAHKVVTSACNLQLAAVTCEMSKLRAIARNRYSTIVTSSNVQSATITYDMSKLRAIARNRYSTIVTSSNVQSATITYDNVKVEGYCS
ncbi:hypothetical protein J6590_055668 [Homalodisca vitripennis]|nr:hypothetical protein J6590_055668 [Homalodisca vitripennis]